MVIRCHIPAALPLLALLTCPFIAACGGEEGGEPNIPPYTGPTPTYYGNVKALLDEHCIRCHASTKRGADRKDAPEELNYDTYSAAKANARVAKTEIRSGRMPNEGSGLAIMDRAMFTAWVDAGMPEGDPTGTPPGDTDAEGE